MDIDNAKGMMFGLAIGDALGYPTEFMSLCYFARYGIASDQKALILIQKLRKDAEDKDKSSPETSQQFDMVLSWVEGE